MTPLLKTLFNHDFAAATETPAFHQAFFGRTLTISDLRQVCDEVCKSSVTLGGTAIPAAIHIKGRQGGTPFAVLAQIHGNEPAGLAGIALVMALAEAGKLERDVICAIGNPLAAQQYFAAHAMEPSARQETRDAYRCGLDTHGTLLPDMNRIPVNFRDSTATDHHTQRAKQLFALGQQVEGVLDIHSARGNMLCITDHKHDSELKDSPIRSVLLGLAEAISAHASATVTVQTLKTILSPLPNIKYQVGIEAGRHEAPDSPYYAAAFTLSMLHTLKLTSIGPHYTKENGSFEAYHVQPRITYADLHYGKDLRADDLVYMATPCHALASLPARSDTVIVKTSDNAYALQSVAEFTGKPAGSMEFAVYQYDEMEAIPANHVVAVAVPSGTAFSTQEGFSGIFFSKSGLLYDKDPAVGPWPVAADKIGSIKFCYPCRVEPISLKF